MRRKWWIFLVAPPAIVLFGWLFGEMIMHLWNWLLPGLFGWKTITFWQGLGLLVLCRTLFGCWGGGGNRGPKGKRRREQWEKMTDEERQSFRAWMQRKCESGAEGGESKQPA